MLDKGHSLARVEMLNWGNFSGHHQATFKNDSILPLHFNNSSSSAILGVNGSGKSSLIDGIMIALFPFENMLRLGVTNDSERGTSGGRSITDYVLGKFASTSGKEGKNLSQVYNRSSGASMLHITLQNNTSPHKYISAGIIWWYSGHQIQDRQFYIIQQNITLNDLCGPNRTVPKNRSKFKEILNERFPGYKPFDTAQSYFSSLSGLLGGINKDDLKIFNRAFYVKSIEDIDVFVRENMLIEESNENLETLLANMENGNQITSHIKKCEEKIRDASFIISEFEQLQDIQQSIFKLHLDKQFIHLFYLWEPWQKNNESIQFLQERIEQLKIDKPEAESEEKVLNTQVQALWSQIHSSETTLILNNLKGERDIATLRLQNSESLIERLSSTLQRARLKLTASPSEIFSNIVRRSMEIRDEQETCRSEQESLLIEINQLKNRTASLKEEIEYLSKNKTILDPVVYRIKTAAINALKIPNGNLMFVGELLAVTDPRYQLAAEAVLEGISKNLLVHPAYLDIFTAWLDTTSVAKSITVKRLQTNDLKGGHEICPQVTNSILSHLEMRSAKDHPFTPYLAEWLNNVFDYQIVKQEDFKKGKGSLVTESGLVRRDQQTMRKLTKDLRYNLGWDPVERIAILTKELTDLLHKSDSANKTNTKLLDLIKNNDRTLDLLAEYSSSDTLEFIKVDHLKQQIKDLNQQIEDTQNKDQALEKLRKTYDKLNEDLNAAKTKFITIKSDLERYENDLITSNKESVTLESRYKESNYFGNLTVHESIDSIKLRFMQDRKRLSEKGNSIIAGIEKEEDLQNKKKLQVLSKASSSLSRYSMNHSDPHLPYLLKDISALNSFQKEWIAHKDRLEGTELRGLEEKWRHFFNDTLVKSIKDMLNEVKTHRLTIEENIHSINEVLKTTYFEKLPDEDRFLQIKHVPSSDERIIKFQHSCKEIEKILANPSLRLQIESASEELLTPLENFVDDLKNDRTRREFVTDVRNHFEFNVQSLIQKKDGSPVEWGETFSGAKYDSKSSAQTTQLAYTLLASSLAYRFKFNDPEAGQLTPRMIILDEFGGKFDNEKPEDVIKMLAQMGFQSILVSPMSKAELLADSISTLNLVHKASASKSKLQYYFIHSKQEYHDLLKSKDGIQ